MEKKVQLTIKGMHCPDCPVKIKRALTNLDGVTQVEINYEKESGLVSFNPLQIDITQILNRINKMDFQANPKTEITN